jgi:hypothetical protein
MLGRMHGRIQSLGVTVTVREVSLGGLSMQTAFAFPIGAVHDFSLTLGDDSSVELRGRVVYCREILAADAEPVYVTGVQFIDNDAAGDGVGELIGKAT